MTWTDANPGGERADAGAVSAPTLVELLADLLRAANHEPARAGVGDGRGIGGTADLTDRERAVATMVGQALSNKQIAHRMLISPHTVNYHLRQIYRKLSINSRLQLAQYIHTHPMWRDEPRSGPPRASGLPRAS